MDAIPIFEELRSSSLYYNLGNHEYEGMNKRPREDYK